jgi:hypothetical protein
MKSPIIHRKQTASFRIGSLMLIIASLWLMLIAANPSAHAQTADDIFNSSATTTSLPADWIQFLSKLEGPAYLCDKLLEVRQQREGSRGREHSRIHVYDARRARVRA